MSETRIYPKPESQGRDKTHRRWHVKYEHMAYDGGGSASWTGYHLTKSGARLAAWWNEKVASYGGDAVTIIDTRVAALTPDGQEKQR